MFLWSLRCQYILLIYYFLSALISPENPLDINQFTDQRVKILDQLILKGER